MIKYNNSNIIKSFFLISFIFFIFIDNFKFVNSQSLPDGFCPSPLIYVNTTNRELDTERGYQFVGTTKCVQPCPSLVFSEDNWNIFLNISLYCGGISLFCSIFLIITYSPLVLPIKRQTRHTVSILFLFIGIFLMNTTNGRVFWDSDLTGFEKMCPEPGRFARGKHDPYCLATGIFYQFGCLTSMMWWSILSIDLFLTIKKIKVSKNQIFYYIGIVNAIAIILTFIPIANNEYGQSSFSIGCWVLSLEYQVGAFWTWLAVCLTAGSVCIGLIIREIYQTSGALKKKLLARHTKPLILITLLLVHFFYMFIFITNVLRHREKYSSEIKEYITCILINAANPNRDDICKIKRSIPVSAQFTFFLFSRLMGFEGALFYGFTNQTKKIWLKSYWLNNKLVLQFRSSINFSTSSNSNTTNTTNSGTTISKSINQDKDQHSYIDEENYEDTSNHKSIELREK